MHVSNNTSYKTTRQRELIDRFEDHIRNKAFPCVGAKAALSRHNMTFLVAGDIRCPKDDYVIHTTLRDFSRTYQASPGPFQSCVVLFDADDTLDEATFEAALWSRLENLERIDAARGFAYDPRVSADINAPDFSLSFGGEAFFVVGLHPGASRPARRFECPALAFNPHDQFESLRAEGRYETLRQSIIDRDAKVSGSANPMLARHGTVSEASQYSGRAVDDAWTCPFKRQHG